MVQPGEPSVDDLSLDALRRRLAEALAELARLGEENAALKEEIARLKGHKGRPQLKPSGMEQATGRAKPKRKLRRGKTAGVDRRMPVVGEELTLGVEAAPGWRFKGYDDFVVQDLRLETRVIRYRRERWLTPAGTLIVAPLPAGLQGHFGPELVRFILLQHHQGQVTAERITAFLNSVGMVISKRQVVRLLTGGVAAFAAEMTDVVRAGLATALWLTVDDTGARHRARNGVTTQIGDDRFTFFATTFSKSRRNFLELLRAGHDDYVINGEALAYMRRHNLAGPVIAQLEGQDARHFPDRAAWTAHLDRQGISRLEVHPDPVKIATEGALWGSIQAHGHLQGTVILSDDAGQFRIGEHALCWVHAERSLHKLIGFNDGQRRALDITRQLVWWLYADLNAYKRQPCPKRATQLKRRFERVFKRRTGFAILDRLLARLHGRKDELLRVLLRPEIPLHTNGSENDIRCHVTKRKVSGGTWSEPGRLARDTFLGLMKTCQKLGVPFFDYLGARLLVPGTAAIAPLPKLVIAAKP
jgi:hypothetical protein